ncbi:MAG: hypothetical protein ACFFFB_09330 [Candidatus Heimdallarchaeota archaeon]
MKKTTKILAMFLLGLLMVSISSGFTAAKGDSDDDGIDDNLEALNKREINIAIEANEISIESVRISEKKRDLIIANILYDADGIKFQVRYKSNLEEDFELLFSISFRKLIEFVDIDFDGVYNPEIDHSIQNYSINDFSPVFYENSTFPSGNRLHHFKIQTVNETFNADIYFAEEFALVDSILLLPTQAKIDISIANFTFLNSSSQLALYSSLESETVFDKQENTEDEENGYAENEEGVITTVGNYVGFYTWNRNATVENITNAIKVGEILEDAYLENAQKIYHNYPRGDITDHSFKIGIEGLLISEADSLIPLIVFTIIVGALSSVAVYSIYHAKTKEKPSKVRRREGEKAYLDLFEDDEYEALFDSKLALQALGGEDAIDTLYHKGDISITVISEDFYEVIDQLGLEESEKLDFIKDMLSLSPHERELILKDMIIKSQ